MTGNDTFTTLVRVVKRGNACTVHIDGCPRTRRAKNVWPWVWAEGRPWSEVFAHGWNQPGACCVDQIARAMGMTVVSIEVVLDA